MQDDVDAQTKKVLDPEQLKEWDPCQALLSSTTRLSAVPFPHKSLFGSMRETWIMVAAQAEARMGGGTVELPNDGSQGQDRQSGVGEALCCYINQSRSPRSRCYLLMQAHSIAVQKENDPASQERSWMPLEAPEPSRGLFECHSANSATG